MVAGCRAWCRLVVLAGVAAGVAPAWAEGAAGERLKALQGDPAKLKAAAEAGRRIASFCINCHGEGGVSKSPEVPNLAGQNPAYLLDQIRKFGSGERKDPFMQGLIKVLKEDERADLAVYFGSLAVPAGKSDAALAASGKAAFGKLCARCHGEEARGNETIPRLAGQQAEYLKRTIARYRDKTGERIYPLMQIATATLKNEEIAALARDRKSVV